MFQKLSLFLALTLFCFLEHGVVARKMLRAPTIEFPRIGDKINQRKITLLHKFIAQQFLAGDQAFRLDQATYDAYVAQIGASFDEFITAMAADPAIPVEVLAAVQEQRDRVVSAKQTLAITDYKTIMEATKFVFEIIGLPNIVNITYSTLLNYFIANYLAIAMMAPL